MKPFHASAAMPRSGALALVLGAFVLAPGPAHADRSALRRIVHDGCMPAAAGATPPHPCVLVDRAGGVAFLKDMVGRAQVLAIATRDVSGIEDPSILAADAPNYFALAWREGRPLLEQRVGAPLPRRAVALAINARTRRSQDQLHIHVDCLQPSVAAALARDAGKIGDEWRPLPTPLLGTTYLARRVLGEELDPNPFRLLAEQVPEAGTHMGDWSLALVGTTIDTRPGFVLLAARTTGLLSGGHAEDLQDHTCAIADKP